MAEVDYNKLGEELEKQELDAPNGVPPAHVYEQLLTIYLLQDDLTGAKFLWKRIPSSTKSATPELAHIWEVGQHLWQRDLPAVYTALTHEWSPTVKDIMKALHEHVRNRAIELVGRAYTSIRADDFAQLLGMSVEEAASLAQGHGWGYDEPTCMILPVPQTPQPHAPTPSEEQLRRLADYVSFLEN
ncbi:COP9 signalosome complex subunit 8-like [Eriocheir sinensis]|uniref:COP9 signalosome complex subunit 8-like n=1 Tax=Eriocheir sinensis TaxID=95602 RepID=UPI0021C6958A|nr:COP9 signalosome complex subunit 8-like [Eriocheir sinensis]